MSGDHDLGYKQLFAHPEMVRDLLAGFTRLTCFRNLSASAFERVNGSFVSEHYSERHTDMLWRVRLDDHVLYVYLLLEFQSHAERWMALRMQVYVGLLYQDLVKRHEFSVGGSLPPVLPVVFYNGTSPWRAPDELRNLVCVPPAGLEMFQASQRYLLIDQRALDPEQLVAGRNLVSALFRIELSDSPQTLMEVLGSLGAWLCGAEQAALRRSLASWIERLHRREMGKDLDVLAFWEQDDMGERFQRKFATWADYLADQGMQKGLAAGREEGRQEGLQEGLQTVRGVLRKLLQRRFGPLPAPADVRIDDAGMEECARMLAYAAEASSLDEVLKA